MKTGLALLLSTCLALAAFQRAAAGPPESPKLLTPKPVETPEIDPHRFRLYKTQNMSTMLLLDSRTGRLWQAHFSIGDSSMRIVLPVSTRVLADGPDGRFSLLMSDNIWNGVLVDTKDGRLWQCQFSMDEKRRFCEPIDTDSKE